MQPARKLDPIDTTETSPTSAVAPRQRIVAADGSAAEIDAEDVLRVRDRKGAVLFEYDPETGRGRLTMQQGDLSLEAPQGSIQLVAGREVRCIAAGDVALHSASSVSMTASDTQGSRGGVRVDAKSTAISSERLCVTAAEADLQIERSRYAGEWLEAGVERAELLFGKLESRVDTLIQRAKNAYHFVDGLHQLKTKRLRSRAEEGMHLDAGHVVMKAREDVDIDGEQINLG